MEQSRPSTCPALSSRGGFLHSLLLVAKGQRKNNVCQCLCIHHMLAPWSISNSHNDYDLHTACSVPRWLPRDSSLWGSHTGQRGCVGFHHGALACGRGREMKDHCCLVALPKGVPSCSPMGLWSNWVRTGFPLSPRARG